MKTLHIAIVILLGTMAWVARGEPVLAGNPQFAGQNLDAEAIKAVLLGKRVTVGDTRVVIVIAKTSSAQEEFLKNVVGMTTSQFQTHWRRLFMTGGGSAPKIVETETDACKVAAETPGGVAIADRASASKLTILLAGK